MKNFPWYPMFFLYQNKGQNVFFKIPKTVFKNIKRFLNHLHLIKKEIKSRNIINVSDTLKCDLISD